MRTKVITVTQKDIDKPIAGFRSRCCPVAMAINRAFKKKIANVTHFHVVLMRMGGGEKRVEFKDVRVSKFINDYDSKSKVEPFTFTLEY